MTFEEAVTAFAAPSNDWPMAAVEDVLAQWDTMGPRCLALLDDYVEGRDMSERTERALFLVIHMLGEKREAAALPSLCTLAANEEQAELILGDATTETLPGIFINMADGGDTGPLRALAEQGDADCFAREAALMALAYLTRAGRLPEAEMHAYFAGLFATMQPREEDFVWCGLVTAVGMLGYADLTPQVEAAFAQGLVDETAMGIEHFREDLQTALQTPGSLAAFESGVDKPFGRTVETLERWVQDDSEDDLADSPFDGETYQEPYVNPLRGVGRNDPCPCGSGKKYKKCCLV